jgi:hypothetical protein
VKAKPLACPHGHPYEGRNVMEMQRSFFAKRIQAWVPCTVRRCRTCNQAKQRREKIVSRKIKKEKMREESRK